MFIQIIAARVLIGIATGFSTGPSSVYTAEIAHPKIRGRLVVLGSCSIATGIMIIYSLGYLLPVRVDDAQSDEGKIRLSFSFPDELAYD